MKRPENSRENNENHYKQIHTLISMLDGTIASNTMLLVLSTPLTCPLIPSHPRITDTRSYRRITSGAFKVHSEMINY